MAASEVLKIRLATFNVHSFADGKGKDNFDRVKALVKVNILQKTHLSKKNIHMHILTGTQDRYFEPSGGGKFEIFEAPKGAKRNVRRVLQQRNKVLDPQPVQDGANSEIVSRQFSFISRKS